MRGVLTFVIHYIYIYIYIYIYYHPRIDCFVVSQLFSVARHVWRLKLGSKPSQYYIRLSIIPLSHQANNVCSGIKRHYIVAFVCLQFCLTGYQSAQFIQRALHYLSGSHKFLHLSAQAQVGAYVYIYIYIYIYIYLLIYYLPAITVTRKKEKKKRQEQEIKISRITARGKKKKYHRTKKKKRKEKANFVTPVEKNQEICGTPWWSVEVKL